jgi:hypothetical protein
MHDNELEGRLDFNQYTREINASDVLLEVQSPVRYRDKRIIYFGALNSKTAKVVFSPKLSSQRYDTSHILISHCSSPILNSQFSILN